MSLIENTSFDAAQRVQIDAPDGRVRGTLSATARVFKGIPYAQPPLGPLRFRPPQPLRRVSDTNARVDVDVDVDVDAYAYAYAHTQAQAQAQAHIDADAFAPAPMQARAAKHDSEPNMLGGADMSEDCLYLNVWSPIAPGDYPVFVWLHGGSNVSGATSQPIYDGAAFARDGVVCVTVGYRLGVFGFLECGEIAGEDYAGSGNNAIRDQTLALQWVRDNIAAFGGDPTRVTLGGESAGAKNVAALIASPHASGLFQSAVLQSGGGETVHSVSEAQAIARSFVAAFAQRYPDMAMDGWRDASAEQLLTVQADVIAAYPRAFPFRSVVDGDVLPFSPEQAVQQGAAASVRLLIGWNRDESVLFASPMMLARLVRRPEADFPITLGELVHTDLDTAQRAMQAEAVRDPSATPFQRRVRVLTAEAYSLPTLAFADAQARAGGVAYVYRFDHVQRSGPFAGFAPHSSELPLTWDQHGDPFFAALFPELGHPSVDMHAAWVAFIRAGVPDIVETSDAAASPRWPPYVLDGIAARQVLVIGHETRLIIRDVET